jgi:hypothetical protein
VCSTATHARKQPSLRMHMSHKALTAIVAEPKLRPGLVGSARQKWPTRLRRSPGR